MNRAWNSWNRVHSGSKGQPHGFEPSPNCMGRHNPVNQRNIGIADACLKSEAPHILGDSDRDTLRVADKPVSDLDTVVGQEVRKSRVLRGGIKLIDHDIFYIDEEGDRDAAHDGLID